MLDTIVFGLALLCSILFAICGIGVVLLYEVEASKVEDQVFVTIWLRRLTNIFFFLLVMTTILWTYLYYLKN